MMFPEVVQVAMPLVYDQYQCSVSFFDKIVHLASWEGTQCMEFFYFWNGSLLFPEHLWHPLFLIVHEIIILLYKLLVKPLMNIQEIIVSVLSS